VYTFNGEFLQIVDYTPFILCTWTRIVLLAMWDYI